jgi:hypothetical protein
MEIADLIHKTRGWHSNLVPDDLAEACGNVGARALMGGATSLKEEAMQRRSRFISSQSDIG